MGPEVLIMSQRAWAELSTEDRAIFREAAREVEQIHARAVAELGGAIATSRPIEAGVTVIDKIDRKPFEDATKPMRDEMRADPQFRSLIERIEAVR